MRERPDDFGQSARDRLLLAYAYSTRRPTCAASQARAELRPRRGATARVDLLACPACPTRRRRWRLESNTRFTGPFNALGWPAIVVPSGPRRTTTCQSLSNSPPGLAGITRPACRMGRRARRAVGRADAVG